MNEYIKWCPDCKGRILTTRQIEENKPCQICQDEQHAQTFKNRLEELNKEEK